MIDSWVSYIDETLQALKQKHARSRLRKALSVSGDAEEIAGLKEALRDFVAEFDVSSAALNFGRV